jgi:hypothetical protein
MSVVASPDPQSLAVPLYQGRKEGRKTRRKEGRQEERKVKEGEKEGRKIPISSPLPSILLLSHTLFSFTSTVALLPLTAPPPSPIPPLRHSNRGPPPLSPSLPSLLFVPSAVAERKDVLEEGRKEGKERKGKEGRKGRKGERI